MPRDMLGIAVRKLVTLPGPVLGTVCDLLEKFSDLEWVEATKRFLRKEEPWAKTQKAVDLLEFVSELDLPAIETFSVKAHFKMGEVEGVKIGWIGGNFHRVFGNKVENIPAATLRVHRLLKSSGDGPIIAELGGEEVAETTLAQMWEMMKQQGRGQQGILLTNGHANGIYLKDANGTLWAIGCRWGSRCSFWSIGAYPAGPARWGADIQIFSRDSGS